ncbi:hypothetical protein BMF94_6349 [Rhodotorula taiwanensis]|uniref:Uncharacterized protein n=1 Tax=Rhodotorula taiwanensis TaxID=741276 RepID=A0A2S5B1J3_9BASI|nr:hypothetical protein BMF94_6349 [Rhodotorula taiwanensis]
MGIAGKIKHVLGHEEKGGEREEGQSSSLPPAGHQTPPKPSFEGPGGSEAPHNGGEGRYERTHQESAADAARRRMGYEDGTK